MVDHTKAQPTVQETQALLEEILEKVIQQLTRLREQEHLEAAHIEVGRWDLPSVVLAWDAGDIERSIGVMVSEKSVSVEVNGWRDEDLTRCWHHSPVAKVTLRQLNSQLESKLCAAYEKVSQWRLTDLRRTQVLPPFPAR